jgi:chemotaxis protein methyltransferase CheR
MNESVEAVEMDLLITGIGAMSGLDLRNWAEPSLKRRVRKMVQDENLASISALQAKVLHEPTEMGKLLLALSCHSVALFRTPSFFAVFRERVVPHLRTYPFIRLWVAGCGSGQDVYSLAILLCEEGLYDRARIYATDMNEAVLAEARAGRYERAILSESIENYAAARGALSLSDYFAVDDTGVVIDAALRRNVVFGQHALGTDRSFNEFQAILCRDVCIYFNKTLQQRVFTLLHDSLCRFGFLGIGRRESMRHSLQQDCYVELSDGDRLFRRVR